MRSFIAVAHRLRTVIDYDRLIVLDNGQVWIFLTHPLPWSEYQYPQIVEFDTPFNLISRDDGVFRNMCLKSGTFGELEAAVRAKVELDSSNNR